jgi:predicted NAD/FAD-dependent oxidoreductase
MKPSVAIIGAGMAGLSLARALTDLANVVLFEKSGRPGGRMASRPMAGFIFDYGAQYFTAKTERFKSAVETWTQNGVVRPWDAHLIEIELNNTGKNLSNSNRRPLYIGYPVMNDLPLHLSKELHIEFKTPIEKLMFRGDKWRLLSRNVQIRQLFDWVVLAIPASQALLILPEDFEYRDLVATRTMNACFTLKLGLPDPLPIDWDAARIRGADVSWICASRPGRPDQDRCALVVHANNEWSQRNADRPLHLVEQHVLRETEKILDMPIVPDFQYLHRWRFANTVEPAKIDRLVDTTQRIAVIGDWLGKASVESAFESAMRLASSKEMDFRS